MTEYTPHDQQGWGNLHAYYKDVFGPMLLEWREYCRTKVMPLRAYTTYEKCVQTFVAETRSGQGWMPLEDELIREKAAIWTPKQIARVLKRAPYEVSARAENGDYMQGVGMTDDDKINCWILAIILAFVAIVVPARFQEHKDAAFNYSVKKPFLDNGVKLP